MLRLCTRTGFHWLGLQKQFDIRVLAFMPVKGKYNRMASVLLDAIREDKLIDGDEFQFLLNYLKDEGNKHAQWLSRICTSKKKALSTGLI
jgi:hypothetical protein